MDTQSTQADTKPLFTIDDRNAMRAYLQRCEVRLSTMHRVVTAFISGAALMVLIPVFFKDVVGSLIQILINDFGNRFPSYGEFGLVLTLGLYFALTYVLGMSFAVPLRGLYLLLKDITDFYIAVSMPGTKETEELRNPTFALTSVAFSTDESPHVKHEVMTYQYQTQSIDFMLPFSDRRRREYFEPLLKATQQVDSTNQKVSYRIVPEERDLERLKAAGIVNSDLGDQAEKDILYFNAALGIARSYDRRLVEEVAKTEMSLVRHSLYLRRLVFRYSATLMIFIWTLIVSFVLLAVLQTNAVRSYDPALSLLLIALGCLLWALPVRFILHRPVDWIYRPFRNTPDSQRHSDEEQIDPQLIRLESTLRPYHMLAIVAGVVATVLAGIAYLQVLMK
ncbi:MAG: hypothetical protein U0528_04280 [Anaerolineae bacterium]